MTSGATKSYFTNSMTHSYSGQAPSFDLGYSLDIPIQDVVTSGWMDGKPTLADGSPMWGTENILTTSRLPEYYAPWGQVRSNGLPNINIKDERYAFDRAKYSYKLF